MPSPEGLEILVRKEPLTKEEWFGLIEARRRLIKPYLDSFTLGELGYVECLRRESFWHSIAIDGPAVSGDARFSLKTQGLFYTAWRGWEHFPNSGFRGRNSNCPNGVMRVWGLTRSGLWIIAEIAFVGESGYKDRGYEKAKTVEIAKADLPTIAAKTKESLPEMWAKLGLVIKKIAENHLSRYNQALRLSRMVEAEELAFSLVPTK